jgi:hypothetical protein
VDRGGVSFLAAPRHYRAGVESDEVISTTQPFLPDRFAFAMRSAECVGVLMVVENWMALRGIVT